jgi:hypothetical protein
MIFEVRTSPMYYYDSNVPAYRAGEWFGKKSCHFNRTRRMIRPVTEGIIFNGKKLYFNPRQRAHTTPEEKQNPTPSYKRIFL